MAQYTLTSLGGDQPASPEEGMQHYEKYKEWLFPLGDAAVSPANPLKDTRTVNPDATVTPGGTTSMSGYTIIEAGSMETALGFARTCPFLEISGSLEVSELMQMPAWTVMTARLRWLCCFTGWMAIQPGMQAPGPGTIR